MVKYFGMSGRMGRYEMWHESMGRTVLTRGIVYDEEEMGRLGILGCVNYQALVDDWMDELERFRYIYNRAVSLVVMEGIGRYGYSVLVESAVRYEGSEPVRLYSGVVFVNEWQMNLYEMRAERGSVDGLKRLLSLSRLSN